MISTKRQSGFGIIEVLIIVAVLGVVGFLGWTVLIRTNTSSSLASFKSYDDCAQNGGKLLTSKFSACLGGEDKLFLQYSAQNLPRINERKKASVPNSVETSGNYSADLVEFLKTDYTGCEVGYYKIVKEVTARFAEMNSGCNNYSDQQKASSFIIAMKLADGWALLSPTDNVDSNGVPSCLLVDMFKISKKLSDKCYENTGYNDGSLRSVDFP